MRRLLQIEFIKVKSYRAFWAILGIYALLFILSTGIMGRMVPQNPAYSFFSFPDVWHHLAYVASYLNILPALLMVMLVANEYAFRTFRQNLIDGLSRRELIYSKFILIAMVASLCIFFIFIWGMLRGLIAGHFDTIGEIFQKMYLLASLFIQMAGYMSLAVLITLIFKRAAFSILVFLVYVVALERIIRWRTEDDVDRFFPMKVFGGLIPDLSSISFQGMFETGTLSPEWTAAMAILYIIGFFMASLLLMEKSDL
jgi:ABC-type transport system involved in multi-copper enzyme maturation permease subunit